jgi:hypothetical protein
MSEGARRVTRRWRSQSAAVAPHSKTLARFCNLLLFLSILFCLPGALQAHEVRPAYLELHEEQAGEFSVLWKTPMRGEMRLALEPEFSGRSVAMFWVIQRIAAF